MARAADHSLAADVTTPPMRLVTCCSRTSWRTD
jgi:hypothetical protein